LDNVLFCIAGMTSSGKDSIMRELNKLYGWQQVISYTTRPRRIGEGETHVFIESSEVGQYKNDFAAYTKIGEYEYFTTKTQLEDPSIKFYIIDPNGILWLKENFKSRPITVIYIYVNESLAQKRALQRGDSIEVYRKRLLAEKEQFDRFQCNTEYDFIVANVTGLKNAVEKVRAIVTFTEVENDIENNWDRFR